MQGHNAPGALNSARETSGLRTAAVWVAGLMIALAVAPFASAGTIGISDGQLIVGTEANDGEQVIDISIAGTDLVISGVDFDVVTPGCSGLETIRCALAAFRDLIVLGGNGDDVINLSAIAAPTFSTLLLGGPGDDVLIGSGGDDTIFGGPGDDVLEGGPGNDCLAGGTGGDVVIQAARSCLDGPEPVISPLPRTTEAPEPSGLLLVVTGIAVLPFARGRFRNPQS